MNIHFFVHIGANILLITAVHAFEVNVNHATNNHPPSARWACKQLVQSVMQNVLTQQATETFGLSPQKCAEIEQKCWNDDNMADISARTMGAYLLSTLIIPFLSQHVSDRLATDVADYCCGTARNPFEFPACIQEPAPLGYITVISLYEQHLAEYQHKSQRLITILNACNTIELANGLVGQWLLGSRLSNVLTYVTPQSLANHGLRTAFDHITPEASEYPPTLCAHAGCCIAHILTEMGTACFFEEALPWLIKRHYQTQLMRTVAQETYCTFCVGEFLSAIDPNSQYHTLLAPIIEQLCAQHACCAEHQNAFAQNTI